MYVLGALALTNKKLIEVMGQPENDTDYILTDEILSHVKQLTEPKPFMLTHNKLNGPHIGRILSVQHVPNSGLYFMARLCPSFINMIKHTVYNECKKRRGNDRSFTLGLLLRKLLPACSMSSVKLPETRGNADQDENAMSRVVSDKSYINHVTATKTNRRKGAFITYEADPKDAYNFMSNKIGMGDMDNFQQLVTDGLNMENKTTDQIDDIIIDKESIYTQLLSDAYNPTQAMDYLRNELDEFVIDTGFIDACTDVMDHSNKSNTITTMSTGSSNIDLVLSKLAEGQDNICKMLNDRNKQHRYNPYGSQPPSSNWGVGHRGDEYGPHSGYNEQQPQWAMQPQLPYSQQQIQPYPPYNGRSGHSMPVNGLDLLLSANDQDRLISPIKSITDKLAEIEKKLSVPQQHALEQQIKPSPPQLPFADRKIEDAVAKAITSAISAMKPWEEATKKSESVPVQAVPGNAAYLGEFSKILANQQLLITQLANQNVPSQLPDATAPPSPQKANRAPVIENQSNAAVRPSPPADRKPRTETPADNEQQETVDSARMPVAVHPQKLEKLNRLATMRQTLDD